VELLHVVIWAMEVDLLVLIQLFMAVHVIILVQHALIKLEKVAQIFPKPDVILVLVVLGLELYLARQDPVV